MAPYRIELHDGEGSVKTERRALFEQDDDAIDYAGEIGHPYAMEVWQGERLVAHFPPIRSLHE